MGRHPTPGPEEPEGFRTSTPTPLRPTDGWRVDRSAGCSHFRTGPLGTSAHTTGTSCSSASRAGTSRNLTRHRSGQWFVGRGYTYPGTTPCPVRRTHPSVGCGGLCTPYGRGSGVRRVCESGVDVHRHDVLRGSWVDLSREVVRRLVSRGPAVFDDEDTSVHPPRTPPSSGSRRGREEGSVRRSPFRRSG